MATIDSGCSLSASFHMKVGGFMALSVFIALKNIEDMASMGGSGSSEESVGWQTPLTGPWVRITIWD